jgi:Universal stress protein UspA and related nucleotide-binding proteins
MKTLVVPTDFSTVSVNAMNYAVDMAQSIQAKLLLLHVYHVPVAYTDAPVSPVTTVSIDEIKRTSDERLEDLKMNLLRVTSGQLEVLTESRLGDTIDELEELCKAVQPFAVIMGSHGATGLERMIMGSTTLTAIRHLKCPVIVVPPGTSYRGITKIGLACDFKDVIETTPVDYIKRIVREFGAELHVLNVHYNPDGEENENMLESATLDAMLGDVNPHYHFLNREDVVEAINEFAEARNLDMVMVIPKKHRLIDSLFHKSKSKELVTHSHIPIVSIHE